MNNISFIQPLIFDLNNISFGNGFPDRDDICEFLKITYGRNFFPLDKAERHTVKQDLPPKPVST